MGSNYWYETFYCFGKPTESSEEEFEEAYSALSMQIDHTIANTTFKFDEQSPIIFNLNKKYHREFVKKIAGRIPPWHSLEIKKIPKKDESVRTFIGNYLPSQIDELRFNYESKMINVDYYCSQMSEVCKNIVRGVAFCNFKISRKSFVKLFCASKYGRDIAFISCTIDLSSPPSVSSYLKGTQIKWLNFSKCGDSNHGKWKSDQHLFENLVLGLGESEALTDSLDSFDITGCGISYRKAKAVLDQNGFDQNVSVHPVPESKANLSFKHLMEAVME